MSKSQHNWEGLGELKGLLLAASFCSKSCVPAGLSNSVVFQLIAKRRAGPVRREISLVAQLNSATNIPCHFASVASPGLGLTVPGGYVVLILVGHPIEGAKARSRPCRREVQKEKRGTTQLMLDVQNRYEGGGSQVEVPMEKSMVIQAFPRRSALSLRYQCSGCCNGSVWVQNQGM